MDDEGTQILDAINDQLKVEDEWALRRQRGFTCHLFVQQTH